MNSSHRSTARMRGLELEDASTPSVVVRHSTCTIIMGTEWSSRTWNYQLKTYTTTSLSLKSPVYDYRATASWKLINQMHGYTVL